MHDAGSRRREAVVLAAAGAVAAVALVARLHNAFAYPPLRDFDAPGHALYVFDLWQGKLPPAGAWCGFHPPLYHALGAVLWRILPEAIPVHVGLRLLSAAAGVGAVALVARGLVRFVPRADAAVVGASLLGAPVVAIATSMLGNETLCALFASAVLVRLWSLPAQRAPALRHAAVSGVLAGLAALSKSTGLGVVPVAAVAYAWRLRRDARAAAAAATLVTGIALGLAAPHYLHMAARGDSALAVLSGGAESYIVGREMSLQLPGERHVADYVSLPAATLLAPSKDAPGMLRSVPGLLYASAWADGHGQFLPAERPAVLRAAALSAVAGLLPSALAVLGLMRLWRERARFPDAWPALLFAALLLGAFLAQTWAVPVYSAVKASYLLAALPAVGLALAAGLTRFEGVARGALRAALLGVALFGSLLTWWGWWL